MPEDTALLCKGSPQPSRPKVFKYEDPQLQRGFLLSQQASAALVQGMNRSTSPTAPFGGGKS